MSPALGSVDRDSRCGRYDRRGRCSRISRDALATLIYAHETVESSSMRQGGKRLASALFES
jgi:hypothetical protein